jgi:hypothetical protein
VNGGILNDNFHRMWMMIMIMIMIMIIIYGLFHDAVGHSRLYSMEYMDNNGKGNGCQQSWAYLIGGEPTQKKNPSDIVLAEITTISRILGRKLSWPNCKYYPGIHLEELRNTTKKKLGRN